MVEIGGNGGQKINVTSVHEHILRVGASAYCASKGGLSLLSKVTAMELAEHGITVNTISPGETATTMTDAEDTDPHTIECRPGSRSSRSRLRGGFLDRLFSLGEGGLRNGYLARRGGRAHAHDRAALQLRL